MLTARLGARPLGAAAPPARSVATVGAPPPPRRADACLARVGAEAGPDVSAASSLPAPTTGILPTTHNSPLACKLQVLGMADALVTLLAAPPTTAGDFAPHLNIAAATGAGVAIVPPILYWVLVFLRERKRIDAKAAEAAEAEAREQERLRKLSRLSGTNDSSSTGGES